MKRVYALYRVSTKGQVDKDDIPMQKKACREFIKSKNNWTLIKEFSEKGISGFKVSAEDRDAIQDLKASAEKNEFDVLLVFMFDRLGRRQNETPFVVEWFTGHGVEVWSVQEGQQKFENEADYLINYMRYWQANGESRKTSTRVKTRLRQMVEEGLYTGGVTPFGYKLINSGVCNKKGKELKELVPDEFEAPIVKEIFEKTLKDGYGSYRMADCLNKRGIKTHSGSKFQCNTINRILRNKIYCGYYERGAVSPYVEKIHIIDENIFDQVQKILDQRSLKNENKQQIARTTKGKTLLSGNLYCAHCGSKLNATSYVDTYKTADGVIHKTRKQRYICCGKAMKRNNCDGQAAYVSSKVDQAVSEIIEMYLEMIKRTPKDVALERKYSEEIAQTKSQLKVLKSEYEKQKMKLRELTNEIANSLLGESRFSSDILSSAIDELKKQIDVTKLKIDESETVLNNQKDSMKKIDYYYNQFVSWAEEFETASLERKKMIACNLFKEIRLGRGYEMKIVVNMAYEQFLM